MNRPLKIGILEGDDIGLEVVPETIKVMRAAAQKTGLQIEWFPMPIGRKAYDELGYTLPPGTLQKLDTYDGWVLGPIGHQAYPKGKPNAINPHPILRKHYDLFANIAAGLGLGGNESYPDVFQPFGGFADGTPVNQGYVSLPQVTGVGFEAKAALYEVMRNLAC